MTIGWPGLFASYAGFFVLFNLIFAAVYGGWTLLHAIDESSPLAGETTESLASASAYLMLSISGTDETTGQTLTARHEYPPPTLRWNHRFVDILRTGEDGIDRFDYTKFHDVEALR